MEKENEKLKTEDFRDFRFHWNLA